MPTFDLAARLSQSRLPNLCPRCDSVRTRALAVDAESAFTWRECEDCAHLWAVPQGWTPHNASEPSASVER